jgi:putative flippase GtrA
MPTLLRRFAKFAVVGVIATVTHTSLFAVAIEVGRIEAVTANALAFSVAVLVGYALNQFWVFRPRA